MELWGFGILIAVVLIETILSSIFARPYFRFGLPLFVRTLPARERTISQSESALNERFSEGIWPAIVFKRFSPTEIAFREKVFHFSWMNYTPVMHGFVRLVPEEATVRVYGMANWFAVLFFLLFFAASRFDRSFIIFGVLLLGLIYSLQARRYAVVAKSFSDEVQPHA